MSKLETGSTLQRLRNRYRLVVMNDDTYEEVVTFRLSRMSVYVVMSTIFVVLVGFTVAIIVFTPLKYYIPGYGSANAGREFRQLKYRTDSLEKQVHYQAQYIDGVKKVLSGDIALTLDTTQLELPKDEYSNDYTTIPMFKDKNASTDRPGLTTATLISSGTVLTGDLASDHDLRIDGTIRGNVICKSKIIIGPSGFVEGNVDGQQADINGKVIGNITVKDILQLRGNCIVEGNIASPKLQMDATAVFNGKCQMGNTANIVQMSSNELQAAEAK